MTPPLPRCVFVDRSSIDCDDLDFSAVEQATDLVCYDATADEELLPRISEADIVITNKVRLGQRHFEKLPRLKLICVIATGANNIEHDAAARFNIEIRNVKDYAAASVSQHALMLMLAMVTRFLDYQKDLASGAWQQQTQFCLLSHPIECLQGMTLGLIGYGHIARAVEKLALAFGMQVMIAESLDPSRRTSTSRGRLPLPQLLSQSDFISLHCPLSDLSRNLIGIEEFRQMKPGARLINTARGGIVNEADLIRALREGLIAGAALDTIEQEPPSPDNPLLNCALPQLILTPHNAWGAQQARQALVDGTAANILHFIASRD